MNINPEATVLLLTSLYYENNPEKETNLGSWVNKESHCVALPFKTSPPN